MEGWQFHVWYGSSVEMHVLFISLFFKNRELRDDTLITRQRAVRALCDYLKDPEHVYEAAKHGMIS